jgi:hypothetical protein
MVSGSSSSPLTRRRSMRRFAAIGILAVTALAASACSGDDEFEKTSDGFNIEPASEVGPHAFTPSIATEDVESAMGAPPDGGELAAAGGAACDTDRFVKELQDRPDAYREWARILGIPTDDVPSYIASLETAILPTDTKVTNHGLRDGRAYPRQSVLTAGTAVLVEPDGNALAASTTSSSAPPGTVPGVGTIVTRCKCGNPLLPAGDPEMTDEETPGTDPPGTGTSVPGTVPPATQRPGTTSPTTATTATSTTSSTTTTATSTTSTTTSTVESGSDEVR